MSVRQATAVHSLHRVILLERHQATRACAIQREVWTAIANFSYCPLIWSQLCLGPGLVSVQHECPWLLPVIASWLIDIVPL